jgi:hypothetical protein
MYVEVHIDEDDVLREVSNESLLAEVKRRNLGAHVEISEEESARCLDEIILHMAFRRNDQALETMRQYIWLAAGKMVN